MNRSARSGARAERGTVLMLFPAAVLILCVLGALAVDSANATMRRRELQSSADAAANDAAALAIDTAALRAGRTVIDPELARRVVEESLARVEEGRYHGGWSYLIEDMEGAPQ